MAVVRRIYIYIVCFISLNALVWALINLLRLVSLKVGGAEELALAIAISVVSLGMYLAHWLWAGRLSRQSVEERQSGLRRFYLYAALACFFGPILANLYSILLNLFQLTGTSYNVSILLRNTTERIIYNLIAVLVLALWMGYHWRVVRGDEKAVAGFDPHTGFRRLFIYGFSTVGLLSLITACTILVHLIIYSLSSNTSNPMLLFKSTFPGMIIGLPVWLFFWLLGQRLFSHDMAGERLSVVRKLYQYGFIFAGVLSVVFCSALIVNGITRRILILNPTGEWRELLPVMLVMGVVWAYHAVSLRNEQTSKILTGRTGSIQRLYYYLVAAISLLAVLAGLVGLIAVMLVAVEEGFGNAEREMLAWTVSALLVGLPVWLLPWLRLQSAARILPQTGDIPETALQNTIGEENRNSLVRKIYLYLFIFLATISVLGGLIFIAFRLVGSALGLGTPTISELGIAMAFTFIGIGVWLYHGQQLRTDGRLSRQSMTPQIQQISILVLAPPDSEFSQRILTRLASETPQAKLSELVLSMDNMPEDWAEQIQSAGLLILPLDVWNQAPETLRSAVQTSPAHKLLVPQPIPDWSIAGLNTSEDVSTDLVKTLRHLTTGQDIHPPISVNLWAILGVILLVVIVAIPSFFFLVRLFISD